LLKSQERERGRGTPVVDLLSVHKFEYRDWRVTEGKNQRKDEKGKSV
jgi:hypothetical protein